MTTYDLARAADRQAIRNTDENFFKTSGLINYLKEGTEPSVRAADALLFMEKEKLGPSATATRIFAIRDGVIVNVVDNSLTAFSQQDYKNLKTEIPAGVVVKVEQRKGETKKWRHVVLVNGDEENNSLVGLLKVMPTISFQCLARFYFDRDRALSDTNQAKVGSWLADGTLRVLDWTPDELIKPTAAERKAIKRSRNGESKNYKMPAPPKPGFTYVSGRWHRAATVLLEDIRKQGTVIVIGQDEGTYFGCEVPANIEGKDQVVLTVADAFEALIPPDIRKVRGVKRQGEWFAVPVKESEVPELKDCACIGAVSHSSYHASQELVLPIEDEESNKHHITADDIRVSKSGVVYAQNAEVEHDDHATLATTGWVRYEKNTALRSYSIEGVD
jgi:hypothetical protein